MQRIESATNHIDTPNIKTYFWEHYLKCLLTAGCLEQDLKGKSGLFSLHVDFPYEKRFRQIMAKNFSAQETDFNFLFSDDFLKKGFELLNKEKDIIFSSLPKEKTEEQIKANKYLRDFWDHFLNDWLSENIFFKSAIKLLKCQDQDEAFKFIKDLQSHHYNFKKNRLYFFSGHGNKRYLFSLMQLVMAQRNRGPAIIKALDKAGVDIYYDENNQSLFLTAAKHNNYAFYLHYFNKQCEWNSTDENGNTLLHYIASCFIDDDDKEQRKNINLVLNKLVNLPTVNINQKTLDGTTPLHFAIKKNQTCIPILLANNADIFAHHKTFGTPIEYALALATNQRNSDMLTLMYQYNKIQVLLYLLEKNFQSQVIDLLKNEKNDILEKNISVSKETYMQMRNTLLRLYVKTEHFNSKDKEIASEKIEDYVVSFKEIAVFNNCLDVVKFLYGNIDAIYQRTIPSFYDKEIYANFLNDYDLQHIKKVTSYFHHVIGGYTLSPACDGIDFKFSEILFELLEHYFCFEPMGFSRETETRLIAYLNQDLINTFNQQRKKSQPIQAINIYLQAYLADFLKPYVRKYLHFKIAQHLFSKQIPHNKVKDFLENIRNEKFEPKEITAHRVIDQEVCLLGLAELAAVCGNHEVMEALNDLGEDIFNGLSMSKIPLVFIALKFRQYDFIKYLMLQKEFDKKVKYKNNNCLHLLAKTTFVTENETQKKYIELLSDLINELADNIHHINDDGQTPFFLAVESNNIDIFQFFLNCPTFLLINEYHAMKRSVDLWKNNLRSPLKTLLELNTEKILPMIMSLDEDISCELISHLSHTILYRLLTQRINIDSTSFMKIRDYFIDEQMKAGPYYAAIDCPAFQDFAYRESCEVSLYEIASFLRLRQFHTKLDQIARKNKLTITVKKMSVEHQLVIKLQTIFQETGIESHLRVDQSGTATLILIGRNQLSFLYRLLKKNKFKNKKNIKLSDDGLNITITANLNFLNTTVFDSQFIRILSDEVYVKPFLAKIFLGRIKDNQINVLENSYHFKISKGPTVLIGADNVIKNISLNVLKTALNTYSKLEFLEIDYLEDEPYDIQIKINTNMRFCPNEIDQLIIEIKTCCCFLHDMSENIVQDAENTPENFISKKSPVVDLPPETLCAWKEAITKLFQDAIDVTVKETLGGFQIILPSELTNIETGKPGNPHELTKKIVRFFNKKLTDYARCELVENTLTIYPDADDLTSAKILFNIVAEKIKKYVSHLKNEDKEIKEEKTHKPKNKKKRKKKKNKSTSKINNENVKISEGKQELEQEKVQSTKPAYKEDELIIKALCEISGNDELFTKGFLTSGKKLANGCWSYYVDYNKTSIQINESSPIETELFFGELINLCNDYYKCDVEKPVIQLAAAKRNKTKLIIDPQAITESVMFPALHEIFKNSFENNAEDAEYLMNNKEEILEQEFPVEEMLNVFISNHHFYELKYHTERLNVIAGLMHDNDKEYLRAYLLYAFLMFNVLSKIKGIKNSYQFYDMRTVIRHAYKALNKDHDYDVFNNILGSINALLLENMNKTSTPHTAMHIKGRYVKVSKDALDELMQQVKNWMERFHLDSQYIGRKTRGANANAKDIERYYDEIVKTEKAEFSDENLRTEEKLFWFVMMGEAVSDQILKNNKEFSELLRYAKEVFIRLGHEEKPSQQLIKELISDPRFMVNRERDELKLNKVN